MCAYTLPALTFVSMVGSSDCGHAVCTTTRGRPAPGAFCSAAWRLTQGPVAPRAAIRRKSRRVVLVLMWSPSCVREHSMRAVHLHLGEAAAAPRIGGAAGLARVRVHHHEADSSAIRILAR